MQLRKVEAARDITATLVKGKNKVILNTDSLLLDVAPHNAS